MLKKLLRRRTWASPTRHTSSEYRWITRCSSWGWKWADVCWKSSWGGAPGPRPPGPPGASRLRTMCQSCRPESPSGLCLCCSVKQSKLQDNLDFYNEHTVCRLNREKRRKIKCHMLSMRNKWKADRLQSMYWQSCNTNLNKNDLGRDGVKRLIWRNSTKID